MADKKLTQQEVVAAITAAKDKGYIGVRSNATPDQIANDASYITSQKELETYLATGYLPTHGFSQTAAAQLFGSQRGEASMQMMSGEVTSGGKAIAGLAKAIFKKGGEKAAEEAATEAVKTKAKMSLKKKAAIGAVTI